MKGVPYKELFVMFPPRADTSIRPENIDKYKGYIGQYKYNGTRNLIFVLPDGSIQLFNRHQEPHKQYKLTKRMEQSILGLDLPAGHYHVLDGELMHAKTTGLKDRIVLYDILVYNSQYLVGSTYQERNDLLASVCGQPQEVEDATGRGIALKVTDALWLAQTFSEDLADRFKDHIDLDEIEGLVLKDPRGALDMGVVVKNNTAWQIRCRKPHKNYDY